MYIILYISADRPLSPRLQAGTRDLRLIGGVRLELSDAQQRLRGRSSPLAIEP
jgi:hypothetical protein